MSNIKNHTSNKIISGTGGRDNIENWGDNVSIKGGAGNDSIYNFLCPVPVGGGPIRYANNVTINGGAGNDTLHNDGIGIVYVYNSGDGNDLIEEFGEDDTLLIESGNWSKKKSGSDIVITVGTGKITLKGAASLSGVNIVSLAADVHSVTFISNNEYEADTSITGTSYNDSIYNNKVSSVTINAGTGNDTIENRGGSDVSIDAGKGNDFIDNWLPTVPSGRVDTDFLSCENVTLNGGAGNDSIENNNNKVTIIGGKGNDYILNYGGNTGDVESGKRVSINGGAGNDYILNYGSRVTITGGAGNDTIENHEDNVTTTGSAGNDLISLYSSSYGYDGVKNNLILYSAGDGNDSIIGFNEDSTLSISGGTYSTTASGNDMIITVGDGKITLQNLLITANVLHINDKNISLKKNVRLTDGNDTIEITTDDLTISGGAGNDSIKNNGNNVSVNGGNSNDSIINGEYFNKTVGNYSTMNGGKGNDSIENYGDNVKIYGGAGKDYIETNGKYEEITEKVTINAGTGNDTIVIDKKSKKNLIEYKPGDGNDIIEVFNSASTLSISGGDYSTTKSGNDIIVTVGNGKVTLKNIYANVDKFHINNKKISLKKNIKLTSGNDSVTNHRDSITITAGKGNDELENYGNKVSINGGDGDDSIYNSGCWDSELQIYVGGSNVTINGGDGNDSIYNNEDNVKIDGSSGNDSIENSGDNVTINCGNGNDSIKNRGDNTTIDGDTGNDYIFNGGDNVSINGGAGNDTIMIGWISSDASINGDEGNDLISVSSSFYTRDTTIKGGTGNDTIYGNSKIINYYGSTYQYSEGDGNDIIYDFISQDRLQIGDGTGTYSSIQNGSDIIVTVGEGSITLVGVSAEDLHIRGAGENDNYIANTLLSGIDESDTINNYADKVTIQALGGNDFIHNSYDGDKASINSGDGNDSIVNKGTKVTIDAGAGNDTIYNDSGYDSKFFGGSGNDYIYNDNGDNTIDGGDGNDTIEHSWGYDVSLNGGAGNDLISVRAYDYTFDTTIKGGKGNDTIYGNSKVQSAYGSTYEYESGDGNDKIYGFTAYDTLQISGNTGTYSTVASGSNIIVTVGDGKITLVGAKSLGNELNIIGIDGKTLNITNKTSSPVTVDSSYGFIDASKRTKAVQITGNAKNNLISGGSKDDSICGGAGNDSILGGKGNDKLYGQAGNDILKGGAGKDSLWGGKGNDSLWGDAGNDTFIYAKGDGKDIIYGFANDDMLKITGTFSTSFNKAKTEVYFKVGSTSNAITLKDFGSTSTFNINGTNYKLGSTKLVKDK